MGTKIGDLDVTTHPLAPMRGLQLKARLLRVVLPVLGDAAPHLKKLRPASGVAPDSDTTLAEAGATLAGADIATIAPLLASIAAHIDPDTLPELISDVLRSTNIVMPEGKSQKKVSIDLCDEGAIDRVFTGARGPLLYKVLFHALKTHFADFRVGAQSADS